jgi:hypothetical protein
LGISPSPNSVENGQMLHDSLKLCEMLHPP